MYDPDLYKTIVELRMQGIDNQLKNSVHVLEMASALSMVNKPSFWNLFFYLFNESPYTQEYGLDFLEKFLINEPVIQESNPMYPYYLKKRKNRGLLRGNTSTLRSVKGMLDHFDIPHKQLVGLISKEKFPVLSYLSYRKPNSNASSRYSENVMMIDPNGDEDDSDNEDYEYDGDRDSNTIAVFVTRLRKKLGSDLITTVRGRGYMIDSA